MREELYRESVISLMNGDLTFDEKLGNFALGLVCETGEVIDSLLNDNFLKTKDELSDCRWYFTANAIMLKYDDYKSNYLLNSRFYTDTLLERPFRLFITATKYGDMIKKVIYHKHPLSQHENALKAFLAQYYVYYRKMLTQHNLTDEEIKQYNYDKLSARYKGLKFTTEQSINRNNELLTS